jgi:hypothetical protein
MTSATQYADTVKNRLAFTWPPATVPSRLTRLDVMSPRCCATCRHWLLAIHHVEARVAGIPRNHAYCPKVDEDLEPFVNERVTMMRCEQWELDSDQSDGRELYDLLVERTRRPRT